MELHSIQPIRSVAVPNEAYGRNETVPDRGINSERTRQPAAINSVQEIKKAEVQGQQISVSEEQLIKAIEKAVKAVQGPHTFLEFNVHETTKRISIKVHNQETGEVIREIPPEKTLDFVAKLWEMAGILIDEKR